MNTAAALAPTPAAISPARPIYLQATQKPAYKVNIIESFIEYIDRKDSTVKGYITCLRQYAKWLNDNGIRLDETTREDVKAYRDYLASSGLAVGTQQQYLRAVKQLYKWAATENLYTNIADNVHGAKVRHDSHKKDALGREDVAKIAETIDRSDEQGKRLYVFTLYHLRAAYNRNKPRKRRGLKDRRRKDLFIYPGQRPRRQRRARFDYSRG